MTTRLPLLALLTAVCTCTPVLAQPPTPQGKIQVRKYFAEEVRQIADACLADIKTKADWEKKRPEYRRQFLEMMGLWPLPEKTDLKATITGKIESELFTVEKIHFQSSPGLYVTGNLYIPKNLKAPAPTILYVCGHARTLIDGVDYGHHVNYQHHPIWFAEHGYCCFIIDTLQLGEIPGIHHGTFPQNKMWWWHTIGYTPAGIECWNAMRALDYLETRKEVDAKKIGVTGRSGGGATSWWLAAADDRPACIIPVAGITDLRSHLVEAIEPRLIEGVISGHCDCMYMSNLYRWDFGLVAALCAPRPLMLGNSTADGIFPVHGYRPVADKARKIYELYDAADKFTLLETAGPHKDTPELRLGAYGWMNRWLKNDTRPVTEVERPRFTPQELKVLPAIPRDSRNALIQESFIPSATAPALPENDVAPWWEQQQREWKKALTEKVFSGWTTTPPPLGVKKTHDLVKGGLRLQAFDFTSEHDVDLTVWLLTAEKTDKPSLVVLNPLDEAGWQEWRAEMGADFPQALGLEKPLPDQNQLEPTRKVLEKFGWAYAYVVPRGIGLTRWAEPDSVPDFHYKRRFVLIGQTLDGQRVWDVRRALAVLRSLPQLREVPLWLQGKRDMAGIALYAAIFEPDVVRLDLWEMPITHKKGPVLLNVRKFFDLPQAVALAFPHRVHIYVRGQNESAHWQWPLQLQKLLNQEHVKLRIVPQ
jgi:hypothetical protein